MTKTAILVASCDKNIYLLDIFFKYFKKFWENCEYPIYVSLENAGYSFEGLNLQVLHENLLAPWGGRIKKCLEKIKADNIIIFMDDFIIEEPVNITLLNQYVSFMKNNIAAIILTEVPAEKNFRLSKYNDLYYRDTFGRYKTSLQCGIWDKQVLYYLLGKKENAWEFEIFGNIRSFILRKEFYAIKQKKYKPIQYNEGLFMIQGKLNADEKTRLESLFKENINTGNLEVGNGPIVRDSIKFMPRVLRRMKIIFLYIYYKILYYLGAQVTI